MKRSLIVTVMVFGCFSLATGQQAKSPAVEKTAHPSPLSHQLSKEDSVKYVDAVRQLQALDQQIRLLQSQAENTTLKLQLILTKSGIPEIDWSHAEIDSAGVVLFKGTPKAETKVPPPPE